MIKLFNNDPQFNAFYLSRRKQYIKVFLIGIIIISLLIIILQFIFNYDVKGPNSYKCSLLDNYQSLSLNKETKMFEQFIK